MGKNILQALIDVSEKAANIARVFRQNEHLFELLVQEKPTGEANPRFVHDYKTLADVLIQETIKHVISADVSIFAITYYGGWWVGGVWCFALGSVSIYCNYKTFNCD